MAHIFTILLKAFNLSMQGVDNIIFYAEDTIEEIMSITTEC